MRESVSAVKDQIVNKNVAFIFRGEELKTYAEVNSSILSLLAALK